MTGRRRGGGVSRDGDSGPGNETPGRLADQFRKMTA